MIKQLIVFVLMGVALVAQPPKAGQTIEGFWKSVDEKSGKPQCVVAIYPYQGEYYGRMIGTFNDKGKMKDDIYNPKERAPGVWGNPYYCGMDFIWDLRLRDAQYNGRIMDPEKGDVYHCTLWVQGGNLIVEGKLMMFSRSQTWVPATKRDFPPGFKMPDVKEFIPEIPAGEK